MLGINRGDEFGIRSGQPGGWLYRPDLAPRDWHELLQGLHLPPTFGRFMQTDPIGYGE
jgi:hypothetical protein